VLILNVLTLESPAVVDRWDLAEMSAFFFKHLHCKGKQGFLWFQGIAIRLTLQRSLYTQANRLNKGVREYGLQPYSIHKTYPLSSFQAGLFSGFPFILNQQKGNGKYLVYIYTFWE